MMHDFIMTHENIIGLLVALLVIAPVIIALSLGSRANKHRMREFLSQPFVDLVYIFDISQHIEWKNHYNNKPNRGVLDKLTAMDLNSATNFGVGDSVICVITRPLDGGSSLRANVVFTLGIVISIDDKTLRVSGRGRVTEGGVLPEGFPAKPRAIIKMNKMIFLQKPGGRIRLTKPIQTSLAGIEQT